MMDFLVKIILVGVTTTVVESATRVARLSVADSAPSNNYFYNNGQGGSYSFNYDVSDQASGNTQYRTEDRYPNGTVTGAYGFIDAFGVPQRFRYVADQAGYRVYRENYFRPSYYPTTMKPLDKLAVSSTEPEITWSRPKRPNKKYGNQVNKNIFERRRGYNNLIGPPSLYVPYY